MAIFKLAIFKQAPRYKRITGKRQGTENEIMGNGLVGAAPGSVASAGARRDVAVAGRIGQAR